MYEQKNERKKKNTKQRYMFAISWLQANRRHDGSLREAVLVCVCVCVCLASGVEIHAKTRESDYETSPLPPLLE